MQPSRFGTEKVLSGEGHPIKSERSFGRGQKMVSLAIKNLAGGVYTVRIFDGQNWQSMKVVIGL